MAVMQSTSAFKAASALRLERIDASRERSRISGVAGLIGQSEAMEKLVEQVGKMALTELAICISGEAGSGKTTVARAIHVASRSSAPFIVLDAGDPAIDVKLFGRDSPGLLHASDGHLVIEEIERLSSATIASLLQWVERGIFERFLPQPQRPQHTRIILTTSAPEPQANDLVARLAGHVIEVPPLRSRLEDVPVLARAILMAQKRSRDQPSVTLSSDGIRELLRHGWPGNVRELASVMARATASATGGVIDGATIAALLIGQDIDHEALRKLDERAWISETLARHRFRRAETAIALGLSRKTLYNKMKRYGLIG